MFSTIQAASSRPCVRLSKIMQSLHYQSQARRKSNGTPHRDLCVLCGAKTARRARTQSIADQTFNQSSFRVRISSLFNLQIMSRYEQTRRLPLAYPNARRGSGRIDSLLIISIVSTILLKDTKPLSIPPSQNHYRLLRYRIFYIVHNSQMQSIFRMKKICRSMIINSKSVIA